MAVISDLPEKIDRVWDGIIEGTAVRKIFRRNYDGEEYSLLGQEISSTQFCRRKGTVGHYFTLFSEPLIVQVYFKVYVQNHQHYP